MLRSLLFVLALALFVNRGWAVEPPPAVPGAPPAATVSVTVDFADGFQRNYRPLPWKEGMTALEALRAAAKHPRGGFEIVERGADATAFVRTIDGVTNEGGGGRNWKYQVNGKHADRSAGIFQLRPGDAVLWKFEGGQ
jgi:biopolymer transport protein ExbD